MEEKRLKISVLCASRNNAADLRTIIGALHMLASGRHDIAYVIACDWDDHRTQKAIERMAHDGLPVLSSCAQRRPCLGTAWNDAAKTLSGDVYVLVTDRAIATTAAWDLYIADAVTKDATRVTWWTTNAGPVIPVIPHAWYSAAGYIYTDYFPFWFDDTWVHELSAFVHGLPNYMIQATCYVQKRSPITKRMRDLRFWMDFFIAKRPERLEQANRIRAALGLPSPDMKPVKEWFERNDRMWVEKWESWQKIAGDSDEPDAGYIEAKKAAEEFLYLIPK